MILTGPQIKYAREQGWLDISDWDEKRLNPNSYNLRLANELMIYGQEYSYKAIEMDKNGNLTENFVEKSGIMRLKNLDMANDMPVATFSIPESGYLLEPGVLYLGRTMEYTKTNKFVPMLEGRSSIGRLGVSIHVTAGFGDIGFKGYWTLEITCVQPTIIYPEIEICQIYYHTIAPTCDIWVPDDNSPDIKKYESGKYQNNTGIQKSMIWKEFPE